MEVLVRNQQRKRKLSSSRVRGWAEKALRRMGKEECELSVLLVGDEAMKGLNAKYRGVHDTTNVLAFPMGDDGPQHGEMEVLGDVVISVETAEREAKSAGEDTESRILYLLIHGILHLLGYDHEISGSAERETLSLEETIHEEIWSGVARDDKRYKGVVR